MKGSDGHTDAQAPPRRRSGRPWASPRRTIGAAIWAAQEPLDKRVFGSGYDDVEILGKLVTRGSGWHAAGLAIHLANGAMFGATYALVRPLVPVPPVVMTRVIATATIIIVKPNIMGCPLLSELFGTLKLFLSDL